MSDTNFELGEISLAQNNFPQAIIHFTKSLNTERSSATHANRAYSYMNLGELQLAKNDFIEVVRLTNIMIEEADTINKKYIDLCLRDIISAKSTLSYIENEMEDYISSERICSELIELCAKMDDNKILGKDLHVCNFYRDRALARMNLSKLNYAIPDLSVAFLNANTKKFQNEIFNIASEMNIVGDMQSELDFQLGKKAVMEGYYEDAIKHFTDSLNKKHGYQAFYNRASAYIYMENYKMAKLDLLASINYLNKELSLVDRENVMGKKVIENQIIKGKSLFAQIENL